MLKEDAQFWLVRFQAEEGLLVDVGDLTLSELEEVFGLVGGIGGFG